MERLPEIYGIMINTLLHYVILTVKNNTVVDSSK